MRQTTKRSNEPDYDEDEDQLKKIEHETGKVTLATTRNQVLEVKNMRQRETLCYLVVELEEEELDDGIEVGICVNPE